MADYKTQHCVIELLLLLCNTKRDSYCTEKTKSPQKTNGWTMIVLPCKILRIRTRRSHMVKALEIPQLDKLAWVVLISLSIIISPLPSPRVQPEAKGEPLAPDSGTVVLILSVIFVASTGDNFSPFCETLATSQLLHEGCAKFSQQRPSSWQIARLSTV